MGISCVSELKPRTELEKEEEWASVAAAAGRRRSIGEEEQENARRPIQEDGRDFCSTAARAATRDHILALGINGIKLSVR